MDGDRFKLFAVCSCKIIMAAWALVPAAFIVSGSDSITVVELIVDDALFRLTSLMGKLVDNRDFLRDLFVYKQSLGERFISLI